MPTKRRAISRNFVPDISPTALWVMSDGLYPEPEKINTWEMICNPGLGYPTCAYDDCKQLWDEHKAEILEVWIQKHPGSRPSWWWLFSRPRMSEAEIQQRGWSGYYYAHHWGQMRLRLGGVGTPRHECLAYSPSFSYGIPDSWLTPDEVELYSGRRRDVHGELIPIGRSDFAGKAIDPKNPPVFESQASYLDRHGLLTSEEKRRLRPRDYEPEITTDSEMEGSIQ